MIQFFVYGIPKPKGSKNAFVLPPQPGKKARAVVVDQSSENLKRWASSVAWEAQRVRPSRLLQGPLKVHLAFRLPPPKSLPKRALSFAIKKPDLDKICRTIWDAMTGVIYEDDSQIVHCEMTKIYAESPGVTVSVTSASVGLGYQPRRMGGGEE